MSLDSVFNGHPSSAGFGSSGTASLGLDISTGKLYYRTPQSDGWQEVGGGGSSISLETNGSPNSSQSILNLTAESGITLTDAGDGEIQVGSTGGGAVTAPTAGFTSPDPAYSPSEAPVGVNPSAFVEDVNGDWHAQSGVDVTTATDPTGASGAPTVPQGILVSDRIQYIRDTQTPTQAGKNALLSINHEAGVGTSYNNQDRAIWVTMGNVTGTISQFSIAANVVTFVLSVSSLFPAGAGFRKGQRVAAAGLSTGTYLNAVPLTVQTASAVSGGVQTITASDSGFTHADVGNTADAGTLDQFIYGMEGIQVEVDIVGAPNIVSAVDNEMCSLSLQLSDNHTGTISSPNEGVNCIRAQSYREVGAGNWGSISPAVISVKHTNFSAVNGGGETLEGIRVSVNDDGGVSNNTAGRAIHIVAPPARMAGGNTGLLIDNFGSNTEDFALEVLGGQTFFGGTIGIPSLYPTSGTTGGEIVALGSLSAQGLTSTATAAPAAPTVEVAGATGPTHYTYVVVGRDSNGNPSPGTPLTITNGNATLDTNNWNFIEATIPANGPTTFDVYRTQGGLTQGKIASVTPTPQDSGHFGPFVVEDKGLVADGSTAPTVNGSGSIAAAGPIAAGKYTVAGLPIGVEGQMLYATNGLKVGETTGNGTGVPVYFSNGQWRVFSTDTQVQA